MQSTLKTKCGVVVRQKELIAKYGKGLFLLRAGTKLYDQPQICNIAARFQKGPLAQLVRASDS